MQHHVPSSLDEYKPYECLSDCDENTYISPISPQSKEDDDFPKDFTFKKYMVQANTASKQNGSAYGVNLRTARRPDYKKGILKCVGQVTSWYGEYDVDEDGDKIKSLRSGTGTVFKVFPNGYFIVITCAHNACAHSPANNEISYPKDIYFFPKGMKELENRMKCVDYNIYEAYEGSKQQCPNDMAVLLFCDKHGVCTTYYNDIKVNGTVAWNEWTEGDDNTFDLWGYPVASNGLLQGENGGEAEKTKTGFWQYDIPTYPGQSGSVLFKRRKDHKDIFRVSGIHVWGDVEKQENNCGVFLDQKKIKWIEKVTLEYEEFACAAENHLNDAKDESKQTVTVNTKMDDAKEWLSSTVGLDDSVIGVLFDNGYDDMVAIQGLEEEDLKEMEFKKGHIKKIMFHVQRLPAPEPLKIYKRPKDDDSDEDISPNDDKNQKKGLPRPPKLKVTQVHGHTAVLVIKPNKPLFKISFHSKEKNEIIQYKLEYKPKAYDDDEKEVWTSVIIEKGTKEHKIDGLNPHTKYIARIAAENKSGWSVYSKTVGFRTEYHEFEINETPWRQPGAYEYKNNEVNLEVIEDVNVIISQNEVLTSYCKGRIEMTAKLCGMPICRVGLNDKVATQKRRDAECSKKKLPHVVISLDDVEFHKCVMLNQYEQNGIITFVPPDEKFDLMSYTINDINIPFDVSWTISEGKKNQMEHYISSLEYCIEVKANYEGHTARDIVINVPVPSNTSKVNVKTKPLLSGGKWQYQPTNSVIEWKVSTLSGGEGVTMKGDVVLRNLIDYKKWSAPPMSMQFSITEYVASKIKVRFVAVHEPEMKYKTTKWVKYATHSGNYEIHMWDPMFFQLFNI